MSLNLVNPFMKFASGGGGTPWTTASDNGFTSGGGASGTYAPQSAAQSYNGVTWATKTSQPAARSAGSGGGNSDTFIVMGGDTASSGSWGTSPQNSCYTYDGSGNSWTTENNLNVSTNFCFGGGNVDTAIITGGTYSAIDTNQTWDGSNWTTQHPYPKGSRGGAGDGNAQDAIGAAGYDSSYFADSYTYDGSSWTSITNAPTDKMQGDSCSCGQSGTFISGYAPSGTAGSYMWDGSSWTQTSSSNFDHRATWGGDKTFAFKVGTDSATTDSEYYDGSADTWTSSGTSTWTIRAANGSGGNT